MKVYEATEEYIDQAANLAYYTYLAECEKNACLLAGETVQQEIRTGLEAAFVNKQGVVCVEEGLLLGYLAYNCKWEDEKTIYYLFPVWGYGAIEEKRDKILSLLFQRLAERLCVGNQVHFEIKLYAHDTQARDLFSFLQFGIQCEEELRKTTEEIILPATANDRKSEKQTGAADTEKEICELTKKELEAHWPAVWRLLAGLVKHLQVSPVFYPGEEFTQEVYREFWMEAETRVFAVKVNGEIVGVMDANIGGNSFITDKPGLRNVGDIYVAEAYRGSGLAQELLQYVNDKLYTEGIEYLWVEHGTANPNARGFWNKYFTPYCYLMIRDIDTRYIQIQN